MDRNLKSLAILILVHMSLSARRAWIEMGLVQSWFIVFWSLSARRAWIEIEHPTTGTQDQYVALRKESVDRNFDAM